MAEPIKGVAFSSPPPKLMASATRAVEALTKGLPVGTTGAVVGVATDAGVNAAIVHRVGNRFQVGAWVGKDWGSKVTAGGVVRATW